MGQSSGCRRPYVPRHAPRLPKNPAQVLSTEEGSFWYRSSISSKYVLLVPSRKLSLSFGSGVGLGCCWKSGLVVLTQRSAIPRAGARDQRPANRREPAAKAIVRTQCRNLALLLYWAECPLTRAWQAMKAYEATACLRQGVDEAKQKYTVCLPTGFTLLALCSGDLCSLWLFQRAQGDYIDRGDAPEQPAGVCTLRGKLSKMEGSRWTMQK